MIARSLWLFLLLIVVPDVYLYRKIISHHRAWIKFAWWTVTFVMLVWTLWLAAMPHFIPSPSWPLFAYLLVMGVFTLPKAIFALTMAVGGVFHKTMWFMASVFSLGIMGIVAYGVTLGYHKFDVRRIELNTPDLPAAFDGYKVALFSDVHVGSFMTSKGEKLLADAVDSLNALGADVILFAGDVQNARAEEIMAHKEVLSKLKAPDGVFAVLGNHDYPYYIEGSEEEKASAAEETINAIRSLGWTLLLNEHKKIIRDTDSIAVAGMENFGKPPYPVKGDLEKTLKGLKENSYVIMLQHIPWAWRAEILPKSWVQLTLSGHTHGGQVNVGGLSPSMVVDKEWEGLYQEGDRALFVTRGLAGLIPFRFGATAEIVMLTLHPLN